MLFRSGDNLHHYIRSIAQIPVLSREETYVLARRMETEALAFRGALVAIPATSREVLARFEKILVPELNLGQLARLLRDRYLVPAQVLPKVEGQPFKVSEIRAGIERVLAEEG